MTTLFLFAHQDDEIGVFHEIAECKRIDGQVDCVFITNGAWAGVTSERRNAESRKTLRALGLTDREFTFLGTTLSIPDGVAVEYLERCFQALCQFIEVRKTNGAAIDRIVMHAWEGGHQDHDSVHLLGVALAARYGLMGRSWQFPLYRRPERRFSKSFGAPLPANGRAEVVHIPLSRRITGLRLLANYSSQKRVILRLLPHVLRHYLIGGVQLLQPVSALRVDEAPNTPPMLYEDWHLYTYARFRKNADPFIERHIRPVTDAPAWDRPA